MQITNNLNPLDIIPSTGACIPAAAAGIPDPLNSLFKRATEEKDVENSGKASKPLSEKTVKSLARNRQIEKEVKELLHQGKTKEALDLATEGYKNSRGSTKMRKLYELAGGERKGRSRSSVVLERSPAEKETNEIVSRIRILYEQGKLKECFVEVLKGLEKWPYSGRLRDWRKKLHAEFGDPSLKEEVKSTILEEKTSIALEGLRMLSLPQIDKL